MSILRGSGNRLGLGFFVHIRTQSIYPGEKYIAQIEWLSFIMENNQLFILTQ